MEFDKSYKREEFLSFLSRNFLPEDFLKEETKVELTTQKYIKNAIKLGTCKSLELVVYEIRHCARSDARVGLTKEVFRILTDEFEDRALVLFVPEDGNENYRFSLIEITIEGDKYTPKITRKYSNPRRYSYFLGKGIACHTPNQYLNKDDNNRIRDYKDLKNRFSVEVLSKDFYNKLYNWYQWAMSNDVNVTFPNNPETSDDDRENINVKLIRLITRLLFVWFIKQKHLVPNNLFDENYLKSILVSFDGKAKDNGTFYNAILQNLFFATLNCAIKDEDGNPRRFATSKSARDTRNLYRYSEMFSISEDKVIELFSNIPFLNGGLFECLDKPVDLYLNLEHDILYDGFSRNDVKAPNGNYKYRAFIPNILFFNDDEERPGLINLLNQYNFTIEENSPNDVVVSLDPELLGRVFENLLADYNTETHNSARKSTGSFYTPPLIVDYMVDASLITYIQNKNINGITEDNLKMLFKKHIIADAWNDDQILAITSALKDIKILDPACGSGAFPMGCLLKIVNIIELLNQDRLNRYQLKLSIIENCLYGVDIQPIAMLICKLRFFISLICEQSNIDFKSPETNFGINTLPNLETKFVAANTLLSAKIRDFDNDWTADEELVKMKEELLAIRNEHFLAKGRKVKRQTQRLDDTKRNEILSRIVEQANKPDEQKIEIWNSQLVALKNELDCYKEEKWVITTHPIERNLFGTVEAPDPIFKEDINKKKREEINSRIKLIENSIQKEKAKCELSGFEAAVKQVTDWNPYDQNAVSSFFDSEWMFCLKTCFDIVIGNPPYISTKGVKEEDKKLYEQEFGFSDDTYNLFTFKGLSLCKDNGILTYITPKTFWTTQTKRNMRDLLLRNSINYIFDTANPFEAAMVDTCITQVSKTKMSDDHTIIFLDGTANLSKPIVFKPIKQRLFLNTQNCVIFKPTKLNLRIYELYGEKVKQLYDKWWDKIKTSRDIEKNRIELEAYRASLKPGDIALLGCLTDGGVGLQTGNNGKYIAVRKSTKWAKNIIESRPKKLAEVIKKYRISFPEMNAFSNAKEFLDSLSEIEIAELFDGLKEKYGRDIFGQGYIYKIIDDSELANVDSLSEDEKGNGIDKTKNYYVPYDKGDKDGNRWYLETPFAIAWSKENVHFLKTNSGKKGLGMPVVRNPQFYFREGFRWSAINGTRSTNDLKFCYKGQSVTDVQGMSLFCVTNLITSAFITAICNSEIISKYTEAFVNSTVIFQINDCKQIPIIIPTKEMLKHFESFFIKAKCLLQEQSRNKGDLIEIKKIIDRDTANFYKL